MSVVNDNDELTEPTSAGDADPRSTQATICDHRVLSPAKRLHWVSRRMFKVFGGRHPSKTRGINGCASIIGSLGPLAWSK
jgi:hypothetical protein